MQIQWPGQDNFTLHQGFLRVSVSWVVASLRRGGGGQKGLKAGHVEINEEKKLQVRGAGQTDSTAPMRVFQQQERCFVLSSLILNI